MRYTLENENILISIRTLGAELTSLYDKKNSIEHLWQADPDIWPWHAPALFPVVGRCLHDELLIEGQKFKMEKHGFARKSEFEFVSQDSNKIKFKLSSSDKTLASYPYLFDFYIIYEISGSSVRQTFEVLNNSDKVMYFQLGAHPAFAVPFLTEEDYEDYFIEFEKDTFLDRWHINEEGFFDHCGSNIIDGTNVLKLQKDMFAADAIITKAIKSRKVSLKTHKNPHSLTVEFPDFHYLGLWAKVNAAYICIEPWLGCADTEGEPVSIDHKEDIQSLPPFGKFETSIIISVS